MQSACEGTWLALATSRARCVLMDLPGHGARMDEELTMDSALQAIVQASQTHGMDRSDRARGGRATKKGAFG